MRNEELEQKRKVYVVRPAMKVAGVKFSGESGQKQTEGAIQRLRMSKILMQAGNVTSTHGRYTGKYSGISPVREGMEPPGERSVRSLKISGVQGGRQKTGKLISGKDFSGAVKEKRYLVLEEDDRIVQDTEDAALEDTVAKQEDSYGSLCTYAAVAWKYSAYGNRERKVFSAGSEKEEIMRRCGIKKNRETSTGVKTREQKAEHVLSEDDVWELPQMAALEDFPQIAETDRRTERGGGVDGSHTGLGESVDGTGRTCPNVGTGRHQSTVSRYKPDGVNGGEQKKPEADKGKKPQTDKRNDYVKKAMLRNYIIKELVHEEGKTDFNSHWKLIGRMMKYDVGKAFSYIGGKVWRVMKKVILGALLLFILLILILLPFIFLAALFLSPTAFFMGLYDGDDALKENPQNLRSVVQEMYTDFYGGISTFSDKDANNQVEYASGRYSDAEEVIAVYLAQMCTSGGYEGMAGDGNYPAYLLIDTAEESSLLEKVFREFNHTVKEEVEVKVTGEDGEERVVNAEKMTVYCLSIEQWKQEHLAELPNEASEMLEALLKQKNISTGSEGEGNFGADKAIAITDLVIPEGVDENLVYIAGFLKAEAGNQPYQGKVAVGYVILNRAGGASGNIKGVLTAPYQFSCYIPYHTVEKYLQEYTQMTDAQRQADSCWQAAAAVYYGTAPNPIGSMKYYCNPKYCSAGETTQWSRIRAKNTEDEIIIIGDHVFCQNCW